jgi:hypothetical protein
MRDNIKFEWTLENGKFAVMYGSILTQKHKWGGKKSVLHSVFSVYLL